MKLNPDIRLHNRFKVVAKDIESGEEIVCGAENIVLNGFYDRLINDAANDYKRISVGSGTAEPQVTDTALTTQTLYKATEPTWDWSQVKVGGTGTIVLNAHMQILTNEIVGTNIAEVGIGNPLSTKALLKDTNGNPIVIPKTDTMTVDVYATAFMTFPKTISGYPFKKGTRDTLADIGYSSNGFSIFQDMHVLTFSPAYMGETWYDGPYTPWLAPPSSRVNASMTLDVPNKKRNYTLATVTAAQANVGGIRSVAIGSSNGVIEIKVPNDEVAQSVLTKEVVGTGDGVKTNFSTKFGWLRDNGTLKVYVNDIEQISGFTAKYDKPPAPTASYYITSVGEKTWEVKTDKKIVGVMSPNDYGFVQVSDTINGTYATAIEFNASNKNKVAPMPSEHQAKKYWKTAGYDQSVLKAYFEDDIYFDTPPASGSTVAVTYQPDCIAKDETRILKNLSYSLGL